MRFHAPKLSVEILKNNVEQDGVTIIMVLPYQFSTERKFLKLPS